MDTPIFEELVKARYRLAQQQIQTLRTVIDHGQQKTEEGQAWLLSKARHERAVMDDLIRIANMNGGSRG